METQFVLVETGSMVYRQYVVEVPKGKLEWATDTVTCNEAVESSQRHFTENIISSPRVITRAEVLELLDKENDYCRSWSDEAKLKAFVTTVVNPNGE